MFDETIEGVTLIPVNSFERNDPKLDVVRSILTEVRESNFENVDIFQGRFLEFFPVGIILVYKNGASKGEFGVSSKNKTQ